VDTDFVNVVLVTLTYVVLIVAKCYENLALLVLSECGNVTEHFVIVAVNLVHVVIVEGLHT